MALRRTCAPSPAAVVRLTEYLQAVEAGAIPSAAPEDAHAPSYLEQQHYDAPRAISNNYARADGQVRGAWEAQRASASEPSSRLYLGERDH